MAIHKSGDPTWLASVLRAAGLQVDVMEGAMNRGHGDFGTIWGVVAHHTGSNSWNGPGPRAIAFHPTLGLCSQLHLARNGKYTVCGVGIAWHAGMGSWPGISTNNANQVTIGIEAENNGTEGWTKEQYQAYVTGVAAILNKLGRDSSRCIGHKEWAKVQGKWDPGGIDMAAFRKDIAAAQAKLKAGGMPSTGQPLNLINEEAKLAAGWIGKRVTANEQTVGKDGRGRMAKYENGEIYWHPDVHRANGNAIAIPNHVLESWKEYGGLDGFLGYPTRRHTTIKETGDIQAFQGGVLYRKFGKKGYPVRGDIGKRWASEGYETGPYGWPASDEYKYTDDGDIRQDFEKGSYLWHKDGSPKAPVTDERK